jgi:hypothetical protein
MEALLDVYQTSQIYGDTVLKAIFYIRLGVSVGQTGVILNFFSAQQWTASVV